MYFNLVNEIEIKSNSKSYLFSFEDTDLEIITENYDCVEDYLIYEDIIQLVSQIKKQQLNNDLILKCSHLYVNIKNVQHIRMSSSSYFLDKAKLESFTVANFPNKTADEVRDLISDPLISLVNQEDTND